MIKIYDYIDDTAVIDMQMIKSFAESAREHPSATISCFSVDGYNVATIWHGSPGTTEDDMIKEYLADNDLYSKEDQK